MKPKSKFARVALVALMLLPAQALAQDNSSEAGGMAPAAAEDPAVELTFWDSIKDSTNPDLFLAYLQRYPNGVFRVIAEAKLKEIYAAEGTGGDGSADAGAGETGMADDGTGGDG
ncbi:MAG: hypothetical protein D6801_01735, partial [Alphaproteobacteria bacterium]